jgi:hypothetical protein
MCDCRSAEQFWQLIDKTHTRELVTSSINAVKAQIDSSHAFITSQRAAVLLGPNAGIEYETRAKMDYQTRSWELQNTKRAFAEFAASLDEASKRHITDSIEAGKVKDFTANARQSIILILLHTDLTPNEAQQIVNALDRSLTKITSLTSWQEMADYFNQHLDELQAQKLGEASLIINCIFPLIQSSEYIMLVIIAFFVCYFDPACTQSFLNYLIQLECPDKW